MWWMGTHSQSAAQDIRAAAGGAETGGAERSGLEVEPGTGGGLQEGGPGASAAGLGPRQPRASLRAISGTTAPQSWPHAQALMQSEAWTQPVNLMLRSVFIM